MDLSRERRGQVNVHQATNGPLEVLILRLRVVIGMFDKLAINQKGDTWQRSSRVTTPTLALHTLKSQRNESR